MEAKKVNFDTVEETNEEMLEFLKQFKTEEPKLENEVRAMCKMGFISQEYFDTLALKQFDDDVIFWKDLTVDVIFKVEQSYPVQTKWGKQLVLVLSTYEGTILRVYATAAIKKALKNSSETTTYIRSLGAKRIATNTGNRKYHDFDIVVV